MNSAQSKFVRGSWIGLVLLGSHLLACSSDVNASPHATASGGSPGSGGTTNGGVGGSTDSGGTLGGSTDSGGTLGGEVGGSTALAGTGGVPAELTVDNVGELVFETYCSFLKGCEPKLGPSYPTREGCVERMRLGGDDFDHPVFWAKGTSLYQLDKAKADACLAKLAGAGCTDGLPLWESRESCTGTSSSSFFGYQLLHLLQSAAECLEALVGTLGQGACCDRRGGCGPGLFCERPDGADTGSCQPAGASSEACWTRPCQPGLVCVRSACTPYAQLGDPCIINNVFGAEWIASNCGAGLYCDDSQQPSRCVSADKGVGAPCECLECAADLYCNTRQTPAVCQAYRAEHEACTDTDKCAAGLDCAKGTCRKIASLVIGEECHGGSNECAQGVAGANCVDDGSGVSRCKAPGLLGDPCDPELETGCALDYDLVCDQTTHTCRALPSLGQACQGRCADRINVFCAGATSEAPSGVCQGRVGLGGTCGSKPQDTDAGTCTSGSCSSSSSSADSGCRLDLRCDATTRTCVARARTTCP